MNANHFQEVSSKPQDQDGKVGDLVIVIADGLFFGRFLKCRNWCGDQFWLPCDEDGWAF